MAIRLWRWTSLAAVSLLAIGVSVACGPISLPVLQSTGDSAGVAGGAEPSSAAQSESNATPTLSKARPGAVRSVPVKRGSLTESLSFDGMATPQTQEPIMYPWRAIVDDIKVKAGQSVIRGDILIDFNPGEVPKTLETARARLHTSLANLQQAQAQADSRQAAAIQRAGVDQQQQQQLILDAEFALRRAQDNLVAVQAGKTAARGVGEMSDPAAQETAVSSGEAQLQQAQGALDKLLAGPDPDAVRTASREVANGEIAVTRAQAELAALTRGADPESLRMAQNALERARTQLQLAQTAKIDPRATDPVLAKLQHDSAIQDAQAALQNAESQVTKLKQPPSDVDVQAARQRVRDAQDSLSTAQAKQAAAEAGPDQAAVDSARAGVEYAKHYTAVAQSALDAIKSHPTPAELADAQDQVRKAQAAVENAHRAPFTVADTSAAEIAALQGIVRQDQADVATAERSLENAHLRAPFDGTVVSVRTKPGDTPAPSRPLIIIAKPGPPIVRVDLDDAQAERLSVGQSASVQIGTSSSSVSARATVTGVTPTSQDGSVGASAKLEVSWADGQAPRFGTPVQVTVTLGGKQDVLVVPKSAVHKTGGRTTVEVQDGTIRHLVSVQIGITTVDSVEIVNGLTEGQTVLAGPT
jgi:HlyD family secretion protein